MVGEQPLQPASAVFEASWRELKGVSVELLPDVLTIRSGKALFKRPAVKAQFETGDLDCFEVKGENQQTVMLAFPAGEEIIEFKDSVLARQFVDALRSLLGPLDEVSRSQARRNEEERLRVEAGNRWKAALQSYAATYWAAADCYRTLARGTYRIVAALRTQSWADAQTEYSGIWPKTEDLQGRTGFQLLPRLEEIGKACSETNGPLAVEKCAAFVAELTRTSLEDAPPNPDWNEGEMQNAMRPNWYHMRFFLLFCCLHHEAVLALELGDWASVRKAIGGLASLRSTLSEVFGIPVGDHVDRLLDAASKGDAPAMNTRSAALDAYLAEAAAKAAVKEVVPDHGAVPQPA